MLELCEDELTLLKQALQRIPLDQIPSSVLDKITDSIEELDGYIRDMNLPLKEFRACRCAPYTSETRRITDP